MTDSPRGTEDSSEQEVILEIACNVADRLEEAVSLGEEDLLRVALLTLERVQVDDSVEISLLVTDDEGLRELNRDFRGRDEATDVLSFPLLDAPLVDAPDEELWHLDEDDTPASDDPQQAWHGANGAFAFTDDPDDAQGESARDADDDANDDSDGDQDDDLEDAPMHLGDIAISRDAVVRQAAAAGHSIAWECAYLFAHGLLHLMGYDDSTDAGYRAMVAHQEAVLTEAHITK